MFGDFFVAKGLFSVAKLLLVSGECNVAGFATGMIHWIYVRIHPSYTT